MITRPLLSRLALAGMLATVAMWVTLMILALVALIAMSLPANAAYYLACSGAAGVAVDGAPCPGSNNYIWLEVGTPITGTQRILEEPVGCSAWSCFRWLSPSFVGTVSQSFQCSVVGGSDTSCGPGGNRADMVVSAPVVTVPCVPSARTIDPCPSGYAPSSASGVSSGAVDTYSSPYEKLPIQDLIYAAVITFGGLLGIGVGVKLS